MNKTKIDWADYTWNQSQDVIMIAHIVMQEKLRQGLQGMSG